MWKKVKQEEEKLYKVLDTYKTVLKEKRIKINRICKELKDGIWKKTQRIQPEI